MAYEMVMPYHLHMPSYFLETFTEYPYFKVRGFIGFSELCIRTFHPDSQRYICPYLPDAHILEFRLPAATIECVINKQGICIEAIMFTD